VCVCVCMCMRSHTPSNLCEQQPVTGSVPAWRRRIDERKARVWNSRFNKQQQRAKQAESKQ
jgi:hypothetical protein